MLHRTRCLCINYTFLIYTIYTFYKVHQAQLPLCHLWINKEIVHYMTKYLLERLRLNTTNIWHLYNDWVIGFIHRCSAREQQFLTPNQKCWRNEITMETTFDCLFQSMESWVRMKHVDFCGSYNSPTKDDFNLQEEWYPPKALSTMVHGSAFRIMTRQSTTQRPSPTLNQETRYVALDIVLVTVTST